MSQLIARSGDASELRAHSSDDATEPEQLSGVISLVVFLFVALLAFGDLAPTQRVLGQLGAHPSVFLIPVLFLYVRRRGTKNSVARGSLYLFVYGSLLTAVTLFFLPASLRGQSSVGKGLKFALTMVLWVMLLASAGDVLRVHPKAVRAGARLALLIDYVALFGEKLGVVRPDSFTTLHANFNQQQRPRMFLTEASTAGANLVALTCLLLLLERSKLVRFLLMVLTVPALVEVQSRGASLAWGLSIAVVLLGIAIARIYPPLAEPRRWVTGVAAIGIAVATLSAGSLIAKVYGGTSHSTDISDATRAAWSESALLELSNRPWGSGFAGGLQDWPSELEESYERLQGQYPNAAWTEVSGLIAGQTDKALAPKSLPSTLILTTGVFGLAFWLFMLTRTLDAIYREVARRPFVAIALMFSVLATATYVSSIYEYEFVLLFAAASLRGVSRQA